jgi:hypothetical protein
LLTEFAKIRLQRLGHVKRTDKTRIMERALEFRFKGKRCRG